MPEIELHNIQVRFPFEPYDVQKTYMEKVIQCLQNGDNGVLESPTGTGKTLCLLCSSLAWLETAKAKYSAMKQEAYDLPSSLSMQLGAVGHSWAGDRRAPPKIIYSSRTHSQLSQAINELKRTSYTYMKVSVVGSRDQLCVHPEVSKEASNHTKVYMCQMKTKAKTCHYYNQIENKKDDPQLKQGVMDLEDLVKKGKKQAFCPYFMARELMVDGDIIFMPYNYLLDPKSRKAHRVEVEGNIVIFDEAHNVEKVCEEAASLQFSSTDLALCIDEITQVMKKFQDNADAITPSAPESEDFLPEDLYTLKAVFLELEKAIDNISLPADGSGLTRPGGFMFEILEAASITPSKKTVIVELLEKLVQYLMANSSSPFQRKGAGLQKFLNLIQVVFSRECFSSQQMEYLKDSYKVHVNVEEPKKKIARQDGWNAPKTNTLTTKTGRIISFWCFHPGFAMQSLIEQGVKCVIMTSGTLSPLGSFTSELQVPFPVQLENPHIIQETQVWVGVVSKGPDGFSLNSTFRNRSDPRYKKSLGQTILNMSRVVPDGLLVFFPSYTVMRDCKEEWQNSGVWTQLSARKPVFVEPQTKDEFLTAMQEYYEKLRDPAFTGACFMAVCRGKVSEGLDFADRNGRAVIITGLPYPPFKDPKVILKQKYLDEAHSKRKFGLTGQAWYNLEASRAVNQAIGRVIRHKDDFGAIILCDNRFASNHIKGELSAWIRPHITTYDKFGPVMKSITQFFKQAQELLPQPKCEGSSRPSVTIKYEPDQSLSRPVAAYGFESATSRPGCSLSISRHTSGTQSVQEPTLDDISTFNYAPRQAQVCKNSTEADESLFSALDRESSSTRPKFTLGKCVSTPPPVPDYLSIRKNSKRRKIKVVPRRAEEPLNHEGATGHILKPQNPESSSESGQAEGHGELCHLPDIKSNSDQKASEKEEEKKRKYKAVGAYILEVKSAIPKEKYSVFAASVKEYRSKYDIDKLVKEVSTVFSKEPQQQSLFKKLEQFVKPEHKEKFCSAIRN